MKKEPLFQNEECGQTYYPHLISMDDIPLTKELTGLIHALAEHKHDIWALNRIKQGWTYGLERNDEIKTHPSLVPYEQLPESEKMYDLAESIETVKFIISMGYTINRKEK